MEYHQTLSVGLDLIGEFRILEVLGSGGFANTYLAAETALGRQVAIKEFFPSELAVRSETSAVRVRAPGAEKQFRWGLERFVREAKTLAKFRHPNIVRVFRVFEANDTAYISLEYVKGADLERWLGGLGRAPTQAELDDLLTPLLDALEVVHTAGILHRDVKPTNIYIRETDKQPVLIDFGAARFAVGEFAGTTAAIVSKGYSPHEAYATDPRQQGPWTDIYGLAATIYRALTGAAPPESTSRVLDDDLVPCAFAPALTDNYRAEFLAAIDAGLALLPKARPRSVAEWRRQMFPGLGSSETEDVHAFQPLSSEPRAGPSSSPPRSLGESPITPPPRPVQIASRPRSVTTFASNVFGRPTSATFVLGVTLLIGGGIALIATSNLPQRLLTGPSAPPAAGLMPSHPEPDRGQEEAAATKSNDGQLKRLATREAEAERGTLEAALAKDADQKLKAKAAGEIDRVLREQGAAMAALQKAEDETRQAAEAERVAREREAANAIREKEVSEKRRATAEAAIQKLAAAAALQKQKDTKRRENAKAELERVLAEQNTAYVALLKSEEEDRRLAAQARAEQARREQAANARQKEEAEKRRVAAEAAARQQAAAASQQHEEDEKRRETARVELERVLGEQKAAMHTSELQMVSSTVEPADEAPKNEKNDNGDRARDLSPEPNLKPIISASIGPDVPIETSQPLTAAERLNYVKRIQQVLKTRDCYRGEINGDADDTAGALKRFETTYDGNIRQINLASASTSDYENWLSWYQGLDKFSCPVVEKPKVEQSKKEEEAPPRKVQKAREQPVETEKQTRRPNREARSVDRESRPARAPSYSPPARASNGGGGAMTGVGF